MTAYRFGRSLASTGNSAPTRAGTRNSKPAVLSPLLRVATLRFLPIAAALTVACAVVAGAGQHLIRSGANEPQVSMAHDAATALNRGSTPVQVVPTVQSDLAFTQSPFVAIYARDGTLTAASALLRGQALTVPEGVLLAAQRTGEDRVTWQPEQGVRSALVAVPWNGGVVVAGRSLLENESRTDGLYMVIGAGWLLGLVLVAMVCVLVELPRRLT